MKKMRTVWGESLGSSIYLINQIRVETRGDTSLSVNLFTFKPDAVASATGKHNLDYLKRPVAGQKVDVRCWSWGIGRGAYGVGRA
jgi:hypothetical protein